MIIGKTQKTPTKKKVKYYCKKCDFLSSNRKDFNRHKITQKHKKTQNWTKNHQIVDFMCKFCHKSYKHSSGLSRHKGKCKKSPDKTVDNVSFITLSAKKCPNSKKSTNLSTKIGSEYEEISLKEILMQQLKTQNETIELLKQSIDTNTKMIPKIGNNNNNTISINVFLNEQCKNAMNLTDFINKVQVSLDDLQYSKTNGFVQGVTNIFTKQLQDLKPTERPIHCSDTKRLQFYVKDDDKWTKDNNNEKIDKTIYNIKMKQTSKLTDWEKLHPNYAQDAHLLNEWQQILNSMTEDVYHKDKVKDKVRRNLANCVQLKQALTDSTENK
jgi:hypothetical protein